MLFRSSSQEKEASDDTEHGKGTSKPNVLICFACLQSLFVHGHNRCIVWGSLCNKIWRLFTWVLGVYRIWKKPACAGSQPMVVHVCHSTEQMLQNKLSRIEVAPYDSWYRQSFLADPEGCGNRLLVCAMWHLEIALFLIKFSSYVHKCTSQLHQVG